MHLLESSSIVQLVRIVAFHAADPGSSPGWGKLFFLHISLHLTVSHARRCIHMTFQSIHMTFQSIQSAGSVLIGTVLHQTCTLFFMFCTMSVLQYAWRCPPTACLGSHVRLVGGVPLELPLLVVERTHTARAKPATDAVEVEGVVAGAPRHCAVSRRPATAALIGLTLDTQLLQHNNTSSERSGCRVHRLCWLLCVACCVCVP